MRITEIARVKLSNNPEDFGAYVNDSGTPEKTVMIPLHKLSTFEPDEKFNNPTAQQYLRKNGSCVKVRQRVTTYTSKKARYCISGC